MMGRPRSDPVSSPILPVWKRPLNQPDLAIRGKGDARPDGAVVVETACDESGAYALCEIEAPLAGAPGAEAVERAEHPALPGEDLVRLDGPDATDDAGELGAVALETGAAPSRSSELRGWPRFEAWIERLAHKYKFIRKITSRLYLPIAFHSGLTMKKLDASTFTYVLPFRRFNRNFYDAMAGAALVANSEIAAGMYLFGELGGKWTVVCKQISYRFLRPCLGPAIYKVSTLEDVKAKIQAGIEFNIDLTLEILQQVSGRRRHPRVGRCEVTFHCAPKGPEGNRGLSRRRRRRAGK